MGFSSLLVTLCLCYVCDVKEVALQAGVWVWVIFLVFFVLAFGWVLLLAIAVSVYLGFLKSDWNFMELMMGHGIRLFGLVFAVTFFVVCWLC